MTTVRTEIDEDRRCRRCRRPGATQNGYCLMCINRMLQEGKFDHILKRAAKEVKRKSV
jgi:hypothetical protein